SSGMGVATLDAEGVMRLANPVAQTLLGLAKGDLTRRAVRLEEFIRPLDVSAGYENLPEIMQQLTMAGAGARSVRVEVVLSRLGAAPMPVQLLINGLWASPERLIGYVVFFANTRD
ncbi:MAG TPA: PAS domain-containing protein, partial [Opitutaceae bacterium]|nr:PAS domain-containing protein [Opitutaceae bacterium]